MAIPVTPNDPRVRIFVNGTWEDIYLKVRQSDGNLVTIQAGNEDEALGDEINPGVCEFVLYNNDGRFSPDNPVSPYYPDLEVSTPVCVLTDEVYDRFSRTVASGWSDSTTGETYSTGSITGPFNGTDYSVDGSRGVHSVPVANAARFTYFGTTSRAPTANNITQKIRYIPQFTDVTGANIEVANLQCRLQSNTQYYMLRAEVTTTETITLKIMKDDSVTLAGPITVAGISHTIGQPIWFAMGAFDDDLFVTAWQGDDIEDEPTGWLLKATDTNYSYGRYGVRTGVATGNTNAKPVIAKYDNYRVYISEFNGDIPEWPQEHSDDGKDRVVSISAGGVLRRYAETKAVLPSTTRKFYEVEAKRIFNTPPDLYWPLDEGELSAEAFNSVGSSRIPFHFNFALGVLIGQDTSGKKHFSQAKMGPWLPNGVSVLNTEIFQALPPEGTCGCINDMWVIDWIRTGGTNTHDQFVVVGNFDPGVYLLGINGDIISVECNAVAKTITIVPGLDQAGFTIDVTATPWLAHSINIFDGAPHHFSLRANVSFGNQIYVELRVDGQFINSVDVGIPPNPRPFMKNIGAVYMTNISGDVQIVTGISNVGIWVTTDPVGNIDSRVAAVQGYAGDTADERFSRLCREQGFKQFLFTSVGQEMGPQYPDTLLEVFAELMRTDGGVISELASARAPYYYTLEDIRSRTTNLTLNIGSEHVMPGWKPVRDNQRLRNKITAFKRDGGLHTFSKTTGRLSTADPKLGGAGEYPDDVKSNPLGDDQLTSISQREVSEGTVDKPRYPIVGVNLMSPSITGNLALRRQVLDISITSRFKLTGMEEWHIYEDADLLVIGHKRTLGPYTHFVEFNTIPFQSLDTFHVETVGSTLGTNSSTITNDLTTATTALDVVTTGRQTLWTTSGGSFPITARIEGEDISVTNIVTSAPAFRSAGTASHGDNATLNPALPAGQLVGDQLILLTVIRNTAAFANVPAGWERLLSLGHIMVCTKISVGAGETSPSCTYSGGAAGDTTSAVIIANQNSPLRHVNANVFTNGSAQNILIPTVQPTQSNGILWIFGWKQDDWTSVVPPIWLTEVLDTGTVTGNDQGIWIGYKLIPYNRDKTPSDTLVVTGGAAAVSKGVGLYFAQPQRLTVVRNQNNLPGGKTHAAGAAIKIAYPKVLG